QHLTAILFLAKTALFAQQRQPAITRQAESTGDLVDFRRYVSVRHLNSSLSARVGYQLAIHHALQHFFAIAADALAAQLLTIDLLAIDDRHHLQRARRWKSRRFAHGRCGL